MERCSIRQSISVFSVFVSNIENRGGRVEAQTGYRLSVGESEDDDDEQALVAKLQAGAPIAIPVARVEHEGTRGSYLSRSLGTKGRVSS